MKTPTHLPRLVQEAPLTPPSPSSIQYPLNSTVHSALASSVWCELHTPRWQMGRALIAEAHLGPASETAAPSARPSPGPPAQRQEQQITEALRAPVCSRQTTPPVAELPAPPSPRRPARSPRVSQARVSCRENGGGYESSQENRTHPTHGLSRGSGTVSLSFPSGRLSLDSGV